MMTAVHEFEVQQGRLLQQFGVKAESIFLENVPAVEGRVHVLKCGEGPAVVMVPGFGDPAAMWAPLMAALKGFTLYAVDRPCFGLSGCADHQLAGIRSLAVRFLEQVLDGLQLNKPLVIGNSIGSLWSFWLALDRPERVAAMLHVGCPALILGTSAPLPLRLASTRVLGYLMTRKPPTQGQVEGFGRVIRGEDLSKLPALRDLLLAAQRLPGVGAATRQLLRTVVRLRGARPEVALGEAELSQVRQPVRLIWGEKDAFGSPDIGEAASRIIPRCDFYVIPGGGHVPWVGYPGEVGQAALPFLRTHSAS
ncbi:MAG TPA: alpha/beta hydrolase [Calditrichia bacterium]|nr:alpha/beta hydrolase [Calditrichia bacterium]